MVRGRIGQRRTRGRSRRGRLRVHDTDGGVEAAVGKSALVGLPVGIDEGNAANAPAAAGIAAAGAFHDGA